MFLSKSSDVPSSIVLEDVEFVLHKKRIKNLYIRIKPDGKAYVSVPKRLTQAELNKALMIHLPWAKAQLAKLQIIVDKEANQFQTGETHYLWGKPYTLEIKLTHQKPMVQCQEDKLILLIKDNFSTEQREKLLEDYYRAELNAVIPELIQHWENTMGVKASEWRLKKMKTRWGTCNTRAKRIWLNVELAKYPFECFEYVLVHELVHLLERSHNARFKAFMSEFLPDWPTRKKVLNQLALKAY